MAISKIDKAISKIIGDKTHNQDHVRYPKILAITKMRVSAGKNPISL